MGGCAASRFVGGGGGDDDDPVALCRERKRLLMAAVDRRYALATAHSSYIHSLHSVAAAIGLFVARHSSPAPILITLPSAAPSPSHSPPSSPSAFLRHTPAEPKTEAFALQSSVSSRPSSSSSDASLEDVGGEEEEGNGGKEAGCGYFYAGTPMPPPSPPEGGFGWDFFNPFDGVRAAEEAAAMVGGLGRISDEDLKVVREQEGIPELEEAEEEVREVEEEKKVVSFGVEEEGGGGCEVGDGGGDEKGLTVTETPARGRDLLEALRSVEDHFIRAYDSGKEVSRMLEASRVSLQNGLDDVKGGIFILFPLWVPHLIEL